jgi:hypothetical protein
MSSIIDSLLAIQSDEVIAYFYCNVREDTLLDPRNILRSFVRQVFSLSGESIENILVETYQQKRQTGSAPYNLSFAESQALLVQVLRAYPHVTITLILDALDECGVESRSDLLSIFDHLIGHSTNVKILISSREDIDIHQALRTKANIDILAARNEYNIQKYIVSAIENSNRKRRFPILKDLMESIVQTLYQQSGGM